MVKNSDLLKSLHDRILSCEMCPLSKQITSAVSGVGNPDADVVVVGDAPRFQATYKDVPMSGDEFEILEDLVMKIDCNLKDWYTLTAVKCCPPSERTPYDIEVKMCRPYLLKQLGVIRPKLIIAMGTTALNALVDENYKIGDVRRQLFDFEFFPAIIFPTYHPKYYKHQPSKMDKGINDFFKIKKLIDKLC